MSGPESDRSPERELGMNGVFLEGPTPPISFEMRIDSPVWYLSRGDDGRPKLIFTITSHFNHPITLKIRYTVLDARNAYNGIFLDQLLTIRDADNGQRLYFSGRQPQLPYPPGRRLGTSDERGFMTLNPGEPVTVSYGIPRRSYNERYEGGGSGKLTIAPLSKELGGEVFRQYFEPDHRYCIGIHKKLRTRVYEQLPEREDFQVGFWWRYGTKSQVMAPPGTTSGVSYIGWSERQIQISGIPDVNLRIEQ